MKVKNKIYITLILFILVTAILIIFLIYPTFKDIQKSSSSILSDRQKTASLYTQSQELINFEKKLPVYQDNLNKLEKVFVDPKNPVSLVKFLEQTSSYLNLAVDINLVEGTKESDKNAQFSNFYINSKGTFLNILNFVEKIENGPYLIQVNKLTIDSEISGESDVIEANLLIQVINK